MDLRGECLYALTNSLGLTDTNTVREPTFFHRENESIVDVTLVSEAASSRIQDCGKRTDFKNLSNNYYITFSYSDCTGTPTFGAAPDGLRAGRGRTS